ncbi:MAG: MerR family transcriptional regulator [Clostridiales Family XIII bacterium]|jgi:DNA-binding transcriptional MerR regulator/effector-binding domain-containing protein|nr:MerR family transcriptional regulator [Clostridiales Family XIII bacterium]
MHRIGEFSKLGKVTVKTIRYYDEVGLLVPARTDEWTGYRYYETGQLFRLQEILALRQMGFSIPEIAAVIGGQGDDGIVERRKSELEEELHSLEDRLTRLHHYISQKKEGIDMSYQVVVKEVPACTVFSYRTVVPAYGDLMSLMPEVGAKVAAANPGVKCADPEYCFIVYHDGEYREKDIDIEICQAVTSRGKDADGVVFKEMPAASVASVYHKGPYEQLGAAYAALTAWVGANGYKPAGEPRESYIDGIWNKDSAEEWLTEIQFPVVKA